MPVINRNFCRKTYSSRFGDSMYTGLPMLRCAQNNEPLCRTYTTTMTNIKLFKFSIFNNGSYYTEWHRLYLVIFAVWTMCNFDRSLLRLWQYIIALSARVHCVYVCIVYIYIYCVYVYIVLCICIYSVIVGPTPQVGPPRKFNLKNETRLLGNY